MKIVYIEQIQIFSYVLVEINLINIWTEIIIY